MTPLKSWTTPKHRGSRHLSQQDCRCSAKSGPGSVVFHIKNTRNHEKKQLQTIFPSPKNCCSRDGPTHEIGIRYGHFQKAQKAHTQKTNIKHRHSQPRSLSAPREENDPSVAERHSEAFYVTPRKGCTDALSVTAPWVPYHAFMFTLL